MPRSADPSRRPVPVTHNPLLTLSHQLPQLDLEQILHDLGEQWKKAWTDFGFLAFKQMTGMDLTTFASLFAGIKAATNVDLPNLSDLLNGKWLHLDQITAALQGIDLTNPGSVLAAIQAAVENVPGLGDFFEVVTGNPDSDPNDAGSFIRNALEAIRTGAQGGSAPAPGNTFVTDLFNAVKGVLTTANTADSKATSAQTTAGSAQSAASNANSLANAAHSAADDAAGKIQQLVDQYLGGSGNPVGALVSALLGVKGDAQNANTNAANANTNAGNAVSNLQSTWDKISAAVGGPTSGNVIGTVQDNIALIFQIGNTAQQQTIANAAALAQLQAQQSGQNNSGVSGSVTYAYSASALDSAVWDTVLTGSGGVRTNGTDAYWSDSGGSAATQINRIKTVTTKTDSMIVQAVLSSPILEAPFAGSAECYYSVILRIDSTRQNYVYVRVGYNSISLWKVTGGGSPVQIGSSQVYSPAPGDVVGGIAGVTAAQPRRFRMLVNGSAMGPDIDDASGTLSVVGTGNRQGGDRWDAAPRFGGQATPGRVRMVTVADYVPPTFVGSGAKLVRTATTNVAATAGTTNVMPNNFWSANQRSTSDITVDLTTGKLGVSLDGWYIVKILVKVTVSGTSAGKIRPCLYKGSGAGASALYERGMPANSVNSNSDGTGNFTTDAFGDTFIVYLAAGDYVQAAYNTETGMTYNMTGAAGETTTYFSIALMNRSYN